jgi:hypothetical protein
MARTRVTWRVPVGIRSAITAEAGRSDLTPSTVVTNILRAIFPRRHADAVVDDHRRAATGEDG